MVKRKEAPGAEVTERTTRKSPRSTIKSPTMSDSAKPKSSTSEASKRQTRKPLIRRSNSSDDDDDFSDNISEPSKPKTPAAKSRTPITKPTNTPANKKKAIRKSSDSDNDESEEERPKRSATATKPATAKKQPLKRVHDSDDDESDEDGPKPKLKSSAKKPVTKKQKVKSASTQDVAPESEDDSDEDDIKSKPKATSSAAKKLIAKKALANSPKSSDTEDGSEDEIEQNKKGTKPKSKTPTSDAKKPVTKKTPAKPSNIRDSESESEDDSEDDDDDDDEDLTSKTTKPKPKTSASSTTKKQPGKAPIPAPEDDEEEDDEDESEEEEPAITLTEYKGDLFGAPSKSLLLHACNCEGSWNKGIAYQFQKNYPDHYALYHNHCRDKGAEAIIGTCLLIPPQNIGRSHWVGCLFTSRKYGRGKDKKDKILQNTEDAIQNMVDQLVDMEAKKRPAEVWMCKINSGLFRVPWDDTKERIRYITCKGGLHITIMDKK